MNLGSTAETFLNSRVQLIRLPEFQTPPGQSSPPLKRLLLAQGELAQIWNGAEPILYIAGIELRPGTTRGNHYHKKKLELVYVVSGLATLQVQDIQSGLTCGVPISAGCLTLVQPGVAHAISALEAGFAIEFSPQAYESADVFKHPLPQETSPEQ